MKLIALDNVRYWVLILLITLITFSSHPTIVAMSHAAGIQVGTILSRYIILVYGALFVMCINFKSMLRPRFIRVCWVIYFVMALYFLMVFAFFSDKNMLSDLRSIAICLVAIMIGWQMRLDERRYWWLLMVYSSLTLFVGLMQVFTNVGGFVISDQYLADNKNSLGVMLASAIVILVFVGMNQGKTVLRQVLFIALSIFAFFILLTIRARTATLTVLLMLLYILFERFKGRNIALFFVGGLALLGIIFVLLPDSVKDYFFNSLLQNREGDITAGRIERNQAGLSVLAQSPFLGNLGKNAEIGTIHNYPLNRTFAFGIVFSFPILLMYFYILIFAVKRTIKANNRQNGNIGYYLLLIPFIISMAEYTFPYGPGTATVFNFLLFGISLSYSENISFLQSNSGFNGRLLIK